MSEVKNAVRVKASKLYFESLEREEKEGRYPPLKARGMGYIHFAQREKNLFRLLFMDKRMEGDVFPTDDASHELDLIRASGIADGDVSRRMHAMLWFSVHGIASLIVTESLVFSEEEISIFLSDIYLALKGRFCHGN